MTTGRREQVDYDPKTTDDWSRWIEDLCRGLYPDSKERYWEFNEAVGHEESPDKKLLYPLAFEPEDQTTDLTKEAYLSPKEIIALLTEIDHIASH